MKNQLSKKQQAFTIIEVMIVLAVAALILLIVFLAVPALRRNSNNTSYRSEAARILAGANEFVANNGGTLPSSAANATTILSNANASNVTTLTIVNPGTAVAVTPTLSTATLETGDSCGASGGASVTPATGAPTKAMILIYGIEGPNSTVVAQCQAA